MVTDVTGQVTGPASMVAGWGGMIRCAFFLSLAFSQIQGAIAWCCSSTGGCYRAGFRAVLDATHYLTDFAIMGSSNLSTWTTIDARATQDCRTEQTYTAPAQTATFIYFRLVIRQDQTNEGSSYTLVTNFAPVFTGGGGGTPTKLSQFTNDLTGSSGSWNVPGTLTASGLVTANTGVNVLGANVLNFGSNLTKETNAGKIGYGTLTTNSLDIVGAGTAVGNRSVKL